MGHSPEKMLQDKKTYWRRERKWNIHKREMQQIKKLNSFHAYQIKSKTLALEGKLYKDNKSTVLPRLQSSNIRKNAKLG